MASERLSVLLAAGGSPWELDALRLLDGRDPRAVLLKRCVDLADLLATATTGQARVAVVADDLDGLDADAVALLRRSAVAVVVVCADGLTGASEARVRRIGVSATLEAGGLERLGDCLEAATADDVVDPEQGHHRAEASPPRSPRAEHRIVAVWGPTGAPGRTTVGVGVAAELAARGHDTLLVDADCHGGAVAQHLGVLDEASGLLAALRMANAGRLDVDGVAAVARRTAPGLRVLTGLPRPDRWTEVREASFAGVLDASADAAEVVVLDLGFDLDPGPPGLAAGPVRSAPARLALDRADELVVVGSADPVGLARLARGLVEVLPLSPRSRLHVVVNRARHSLGWGERDVRTMVEGFAAPAGVHFIPDDRAAADRALVAGRSLVETGDSALRRALAGVAAAVWAPAVAAGASGAGRLRRRTAGRAR